MGPADDLASAADVATGAVLARAVEPQAGEAADPAGAAACLNCGTRLAGAYCSHCGQKAQVHRTLGAFAHDALHSLLHFDGKVWRTLPLLAWRPGDLTRRYIHGERARFVSPLALFLFCVFLAFAVFGTRSVALVGADAATVAQLQVDLQAERGAGGGTLRALAERAAANPQLLVYKLQSNAYKFAWALIPISVPFVWLLFARRREFRLFDHAVFVTYSLCFMMLLAIVTALAGQWTWLEGAAAAAMVVLPPLHMYRQLRQAYGLGTGAALGRTLLLMAFAALSLAMFGALILALGLGR